MRTACQSFAAALLLVVTTAGAGEAGTFTWSFDSSADAVSAAGAVRKAEVKRTPRFVTGVTGRALDLSSNPSLIFDAKELFASEGTLSFWYSAGFSGRADQPVQHLFTLTRANGKQVPFAWFHVYEGLSFRMPTRQEEIFLKTAVSSFEQIQKNDWVHVALTWGERKWTTVYVNGIATNWKRFSGVDFSDMLKLTIGSPEHSKTAFQGRIDEVKLFRRPLSEKEVFREYASHALADAWMEQSLFPANRRIRPEVRIAPLGTLRGDNPKAPWMGIPFCGSVHLSLKDSTGKLLEEQKWEKLSVAKMKSLRLPETLLPAGRYSLELNMVSDRGATTRFFDICMDEMNLNNPEDGEIRLGPPIWSCSAADFSSTKPVSKGELDGIAFVEGGDSKDDRIFCELKIPKCYTSEQLLCLEIEWPDNKARAMGLYLYPPKGSQSQIRDRLGGGIYTGGEFPVSGKMRKTSWLFYAGYTDWLFEIRNSISGKPAAVAGVRILPVEGPLPRLKINLPDGLPGRRIGHLDEDQSFDYNLDWDNARGSGDPWKLQSKTIRLLLNYYAYTGQNLFTLPLMRYYWTDYARIYSPCKSMGPLNKAGYWLDRLRENQIDFIAIVNLMNVPELQNLKRGREYRRKGMTSASVEGPLTGATNRNNPIHPENRKMLLAHLEEFMCRVGSRPEIAGIDFWCTWPIVSFQDLEHGYDDYTVMAFSRETGVSVPDFADDIYRRRWRFLTSAPVREKWIQWRVNKTTEIFREIRRVIDHASPGKALFITVSLPQGKKDDESIDALDIEKYLHEEKSMDIKALNAMPATMVVPMRHSLEQIWNQHWSGNITVSDEAQNNRLFTLPFRRTDRNYVNCYRTYFETFSQSAMQEKYPSVFQNIELKPVGRYFLKELSLALAFNDAQRIAIGAQPLASLGREKEMREFVKAYRALPDLPFLDVPGAFDPVTVRWRRTKNGIYLYAVNMIRSELSAELKLDGALSVKDLSSGKCIALADNAVLVDLKPFELRSFLIAGETVPELKAVRIPEAFEKSCVEKLRSLNDIQKKFAASGADNSAVTERLRKCAAALAEKHYAEFDRLLYSKLLQMLVRDQGNLASGVISDAQKQLASHDFRINCGSADYLRAGSGVFLPDRKWSESAQYGYLGNGAMTTERSDNLPSGNPLRRLFQTELYSVTGYRFRVPQTGKYTLRLYQRVGYEPARKKGNFVVDISVNGKTLRRNYDIFANESEKTGMAVLTLSGITPVNGMVTLEMKPSGERDKTVVILNGIELEREK